MLWICLSLTQTISCFRTNIGRARAWIRLALMQKKLADYMRTLVEKMKDVLADYYGIAIIAINMLGKLKSYFLVPRCNRSSQIGGGSYGGRVARQSQRR